MLGRASWRVYDSHFRLAKFLLARSGLRPFLTRDGPDEKPLGRLVRTVDTRLRRLLASNIPNPLVVGGHTFLCDPSDYDFILLLAHCNYEPEVTELLQDRLKGGMTFVDLGAHVGYYTLLAARAVGTTGRVYAFEPEPANYALLGRNVETNGYGNVVTRVRKAVYSTCAALPLFQDRRDASAYVRSAIGAAPTMVEAITLDAFFSEADWPPVHFIKMDIEGAEKAALEGMVELSHRNPELKMISEFNIECIDAAGISPGALFGALRALGFSRFSVIEEGGRLLHIPEDIPALVRQANHSILNLLCEKERV